MTDATDSSMYRRTAMRRLLAGIDAMAASHDFPQEIMSGLRTYASNGYLSSDAWQLAQEARVETLKPRLAGRWPNTDDYVRYMCALSAESLTRFADSEWTPDADCASFQLFGVVMRVLNRASDTERAMVAAAIGTTRPGNWNIEDLLRLIRAEVDGAA